MNKIVFSCAAESLFDSNATKTLHNVAFFQISFVTAFPLKIPLESIFTCLSDKIYNNSISNMDRCDLLTE